jgi:adenylosuccinate lyase
VENGIQRQTAYVMVQRNAMKAWDNKEQFLSVLKTDDEVMDNFSEEELEGLFSYRKVYESVDFMFERLGLS